MRKRPQMIDCPEKVRRIIDTSNDDYVTVLSGCTDEDLEETIKYLESSGLYPGKAKKIQKEIAARKKEKSGGSHWRQKDIDEWNAIYEFCQAVKAGKRAAGMS